MLLPSLSVRLFAPSDGCLRYILSPFYPLNETSECALPQIPGDR